MEVDFVLNQDNKLVAIEVKSGQRYSAPKGLAAFSDKFNGAKTMIVGEGGGVPLAEFFLTPASKWLE